MQRDAAEQAQPNAETTVATKLLRAVIAKAFLEILFICVIATLAAFKNYSPLLRGAIDAADQTRISGWAHDPLTPDQSLDVQLFIDDQFIATQRAHQRRDDLVRAGATTLPNHGFRFELTSVKLAEGRHAAQVYAVRMAAGVNKMLLPLAKQPVVFEVQR
ncbi:MAG: hypothetical protein HYR56_25615 [Acidobacteria bacterium]|nr:hypothetical protein [Acidobacteriota bacterium]MBI3423287.1 hypothetical protein [Acidobacteriota bacterium]